MSSPARDPIQEAVRQLRRLPGIGEKTAARLVYWLLRAKGDVAADLASALGALGEGIHECRVCCDLTGLDPCRVCQDPRRETGSVLVVEQP